jgi:hypothetical protein
MHVHDVGLDLTDQGNAAFMVLPGVMKFSVFAEPIFEPTRGDAENVVPEPVSLNRRVPANPKNALLNAAIICVCGDVEDNHCIEQARIFPQ